MRRKFYAAAVIVAAAALFGVTGSASGNTVATANGTWDAYPGQSTTYQTAVKGAINADGSSNFKANGKGVIPVQFALSEGIGPFAFESIWSDESAANNYSYLVFTPSSAITFADITSLVANYSFTEGDCYGGSLRWTINVQHNGAGQNVYDYYGDPGGVQSCSGGADESGDNLLDDAIGLPANRFEWQGGGSPVYTTYAAIKALANDGADRVNWIGLQLDSGWFNAPYGDQIVDLTEATIGVGGTSPYSETFTPQEASALAPTCDLPNDAEIQVTKTGGSEMGPINEPISIQPNDTDGVFRVVDCKLMYNLAIGSLSGAGTYKVEAVIDGTTADGAATFQLK